MIKKLTILIVFLISMTSCSIFEDNDDPGINSDLYLRTVFQGVIYDKQGNLMLNAEVQVDLFSEKEGEPKSRSVNYTDDFGGFTNVFKLGTTRQEWYYRLYVKPPRETEQILASEGPVVLGSQLNLELRLGE